MRENFLKQLYPQMSGTKADVEKVEELSLNDCKSLIATVGDGLTVVFGQRRTLEREKRGLVLERDALNKRIKELGGSTVRFCKALITVRAAVSAKVTVELLSLVGGCNWATNYDARLKEDGKVELSYYADIRQHTGEEWKDVLLALSTCSVANITLPPELKMLALKLSEVASKEPQRGGFTSARTPSPDNWDALSSGKAPSPRKAGLETQGTSRKAGGGVAVEFTIPAKASIPGDGTVRRLLVKKLFFDGSLEYETLPRISPNVFARVEIINNSEFPLLAGTIRSFSGGEFLGGSRFETVAMGGEFKLYFGSDPAIEAKYRPLKRRLDTGKRTNEIEFEWLLDITNKRSRKVVINVLDALPKLGNDEIKIKSVKIDPRPDNDPDKHPDRHIKWKLTLEPNEKASFRIRFRVLAPSDKQLVWEGSWEGGVR